MAASAQNLVGASMPPLQAVLIGNTIATVAGVGTSQGAGAPLLNNVTLGTTTGGATAFVISTKWSIGDEITFFNLSSTTALLFPPSGCSIDGGSTDAAINVVQNQGFTLLKTSATTWRSGATLSTTTLSISGNATIGGTLGVTGASTLSGNTTVGGTLGVTGATTLSAAATVGTTLGVTGMSTLTGGLTGGAQTLTGAGAVNLTTVVTEIVSTGSDALTLADGVNGQIKIIVMKTDGGDATLTPTTKTGFTTIVFNDAGDGCVLVFTTTTGWIVAGNNGCTIS